MSTVERSILGVAAALVSSTQVPLCYSVFVPSLYDVSNDAKNDPAETLRWVRRGETNAFVLSFAIGTSAAILSKSWLPLLGTTVVSAFLLWHYEQALNCGLPANATEERDDV